MAITKRVVQDAFSRIGVSLRDHHVDARVDYKQVTFQIRLGRRFNPMPTGQWLQKEDRAGRVGSGTIEGAKYLLFGHARRLLDGG